MKENLHLSQFYETIFIYPVYLYACTLEHFSAMS